MGYSVDNLMKRINASNKNLSGLDSMLLWVFSEDMDLSRTNTPIRIFNQLFPVEICAYLIEFLMP